MNHLTIIIIFFSGGGGGGGEIERNLTKVLPRQCGGNIQGLLHMDNQRTNGPVNAHLSLLHIPINMFEYYGI